jgi:hypothetical protein
MTQVRSDRIPKRCIAYEDHLTQRRLFFFYRAHESLAMRVQMWTVRRQHHRLHPTVLQQGVECLVALESPGGNQRPGAEPM